MFESGLSEGIRLVGGQLHRVVKDTADAGDPRSNRAIQQQVPRVSDPALSGAAANMTKVVGPDTLTQFGSGLATAALRVRSNSP